MEIRLIRPEDNKAVEQVIRSCLIEYGANHEGTAYAGNYYDHFTQKGSVFLF